MKKAHLPNQQCNRQTIQCIASKFDAFPLKFPPKSRLQWNKAVMDILDDSKPTSVRKESRNLAMSPRLSNPILKMVDAKQAWFLCEKPTAFPKCTWTQCFQDGVVGKASHIRIGKFWRYFVVCGVLFKKNQCSFMFKAWDAWIDFLDH